MQIGLVGLGRMGVAIGQRLIELGYNLTVWNRSPDKAKPLTDLGAVFVSNPAEVADRAEIILSILTDAAAIDAVYSGPAGLLSTNVQGKLFIEMSTVRPETEIALATKVQAEGAALVECPVGGSTGPARQGKLIGLMGGSEADAARARVILQQLCKRLEHIGPIGSGSTMKLAINLPLMIYWQAFGEALAMCRDLKLDPAQMIDLFTETSGGTNALKVRGPAIAAMLSGGDPGLTGFDIDSGRKDLRTMIAEAKSRGIELPLAERTLACFDEASREGWGGRDGSTMPVFWSRRGK
ncbi:MAG TPA: NAD(P)-dependent oxidoreductase [Xanthobacteraceae bacterium]|nr:NAD(P)-dependent oxidoreductase [Xanthobacteraceae bacterium]